VPHRPTSYAAFTMKPVVFTIVVFALALALRLGGPRSVGPYDEAYHWKRITWVAERGSQTADRGPQTTHGLTALDFDLDRGIHGAFCPWPPLYDAAMGAVAKMIGLERIIWIPPIAFALFAAVIVAVWGRRGEDDLATSQLRDLATMGNRDTERVILSRAIARARRLRAETLNRDPSPRRSGERVREAGVRGLLAPVVSPLIRPSAP